MRAHLASLVDEFRKHSPETAVVAHRGVRRYATTYGELAEIAGRFAAELDRRQILPGERVVLWGADSAEWIGVFFGCLLRAVIVVPLDAAGNPGFAARVVKDVGARLVVGDAELLTHLDSLFPDPCSLFMDLRAIREHLPPKPLWAVSDAVALDTPFQIVFTSGTTSEPRGIVHTHRNVLVTLDPIEREIDKYRRLERIFHPLRFLHSLPLSHVFGQFMGLWCPALLAAEVHFAEDLEPARIVELIKRERISVLVAVPRVLQLLRVHLLGRFGEVSPVLRTNNSQLATVLKKWWRNRALHRALGWKFWAVISGGATLPAELEAFWGGLGFALIQGYGMTETTALVTLNHPFHIKEGTIGKTLPGREVRIGEDGEILVRGDVVAGATWERGAIRRRQGEWLATGDLAQEDSAGELRFVGRKGDVIVTGAGMNVHPADLEQALAAQPGVRGCVVVGCNFAAGPEAQAVVLFSGTEDELAFAVKQANRSLAEYQQIRHWVRWPELTFPYTSTGKLLRRAVADWVCARGAQASATSPTALATSDSVLALLAEVTGEAVSANGDPDRLRLSEDLHLDSLGRVQLQSSIEQRFDVELEDDALAAIETVGQLRALLERTLIRSSSAHSSFPTAVRSSSTDNAAIPDPTSATNGEAPATVNIPPATTSDHPTTNRERQIYPRWPWWSCVRAIRIVWIEAIMRPLVWLFARPKVVLQTTEFADPPALIVCNHITAYDGALVLYALPGRLRRHVACAMSGEMLMDFRRARNQGNWVLNLLAPGAWFLLTALFNVFPLPRAQGFRRSFAHAGAAMVRGYSVLIFPEGSRSRDGRMHPFRAGIGLLAKQSAVPILPVGLRGLYSPGRWFHAGRIEVHIGPPVPAANDLSNPSDLTARLEAAVRQLIDPSSSTEGE